MVADAVGDGWGESAAAGTAAAVAGAVTLALRVLRGGVERERCSGAVAVRVGSVAAVSGGGAGGGATVCTTGDCGAKLIVGDAAGAGAGAGASAGAGTGVMVGGVTGCVSCAAAGIAAPASNRLKATR
ncbi:hypothetical protein SCH01S_50_00020 [Sphingomonas changbaiensis NBRC 104936]|uniref:Uncharacterized protein n=1 Tax=Sphingomonas changbaiensis NBRC 104936 TaxID=1219043 RepID=A0A0E9MU17_9SPHN|nr:hypothetical protein SCH01S_50_00020 [Sphingomonas changbaiensis NBRC 104936]